MRRILQLFEPPGMSPDAAMWKARFDALALAPAPEHVAAAERAVEVALDLAKRLPITFDEAVRLVLDVVRAMGVFDPVALARVLGEDPT